MAAGVKAWVEAMRLRTLPVSAAGVVTGCACGIQAGSFRWLPAVICLLFALMAQICSNFANEYFDYRNGLDRPGREGFRRGVTEGDISPRAMRNATIGLAAATCVVGCLLIIWGGWWLVPVGIVIVIAAYAYSAGPWPLSHHGMGEVAVLLFFGLIPVILTAWLQTGSWNILPTALPMGFAIGLMGANVMLVNNYRDYADDRSVGKRTLAVIIGRRATLNLYLANGFMALLCIEVATIARVSVIWQIVPLLYINQHWLLWQYMRRATGHELNPLLGKTASLMLPMALWILLAYIFN